MSVKGTVLSLLVVLCCSGCSSSSNTTRSAQAPGATAQPAVTSQESASPAVSAAAQNPTAGPSPSAGPQVVRSTPAGTPTPAPASATAAAAGALSSASPGSRANASRLPTRTPTPASAGRENPLATSLLVVAGDLPDTWKTAPVDETPNPLNACNTLPVGQTAEVKSERFQPDEHSEIDETLVVTDTPAHARAAVDRVPDQIACGLRLINSGALDDAGVSFSEATSSTTTLPALGDASQGYRIRIRATGKASGQSTDIFEDVIYVVRGRAAIQVSATTDSGKPIKPGALLLVAFKAVQKLDGLPPLP